MFPRPATIAAVVAAPSAISSRRRSSPLKNLLIEGRSFVSVVNSFLGIEVNGRPFEMSEDLGHDEPATERRQVTAAEPVDFRLTPVLPQRVRVFGRHDLVA